MQRNPSCSTVAVFSYTQQDASAVLQFEQVTVSFKIYCGCSPASHSHKTKGAPCLLGALESLFDFIANSSVVVDWQGLRLAVALH